MKVLVLPGGLTIFISDSPFQNESVDHALMIAETARRKGHNVNIYLMMDGVYNPITSQNGEPFNVSPISERLTELTRSGVNVSSCRVCMELRGVRKEDIPKEVDVGGIFDLSEMINESDVFLNFVGRG